jgi:predicted choloylglycine hydrolase
MFIRDHWIGRSLDAMTKPRLQLHRLRGTAAAVGEAYGRTFEQSIMGFAHQELKPDKTKLAYARKCWKHVEKAAPHSARLMKGIARGANLSIEHITLLSLHEEVMHMPHCTAFAASGASTRGGDAVVAMNWDWDSHLWPWSGLLHLTVKGSPRMATYHYPGLWAGAGVNEHGNAFMWTGSGYAPRLKPVVGVPTYVLIYEILRRRTVRDALRFLHDVIHAGSFIFFLGDATGDIAVVEGMPGRLSVDQSADALGRANHYENPDVVKASKQAPSTDKRNNSSCYRSWRMWQLLEQHHGRISAAVSKTILIDRSGTGQWINQFPHGKGKVALGGMTIDSLVADCKRRTLHTCRGGREFWGRGKV